MGGPGLKTAIENDEAVKAHLSQTEIDHAFDVRQHLKHIDETFRRLGLG